MTVLFSYTGRIEKLSKDAIPSEIIDEWERTLKGERLKIITNMLRQIPDQAAFIAKIANPSSDNYASFVNPYHPKATVATLKQRMKLKTAYDDWLAGVQNAFAEGGVFETNVSAKKEKWRNIAYAFASVLNKSLMGKGAIVKAAEIMTGDNRVLPYLTAKDSFTGTPTNVFQPQFARYVKPIIIAKGVFASTYAFLANDAGEIGIRNLIITNVSDDFAALISAFKDPGITRASLWLSYDEDTDEIVVNASAEADVE